jgi:flagellar hook-length control protein FliK
MQPMTGPSASRAQAPPPAAGGRADAVAGIVQTDAKAQLLSLLQSLSSALQTTRPASTAARSPTPAHPGNRAESLYGAAGTRLDHNAAEQAVLALALGNPMSARTLRMAREDNAAARAGSDTVELLLRYVLGALARTRVHQLSSHTDSRQQSDPAPLPSWSLELPLFNGNRHDALELRITQHEADRGERDTLERSWEVMLRLDIEGLGAVHASLHMQGSTLAATLWAERADTLQLARSHLHELAEQLAASGIELRRLECRSGEPEAHLRMRLDRLVDVTT